MIYMKKGKCIMLLEVNHMCACVYVRVCVCVCVCLHAINKEHKKCFSNKI